MSPSVSLEKEEETEVVVLGVRPRTFSDSSRVFLLAGPLLTRVYAARERSDIFSGACRRRLISSYEIRYFPLNRSRQWEGNQHSMDLIVFNNVNHKCVKLEMYNVFNYISGHLRALDPFMLGSRSDDTSAKGMWVADSGFVLEFGGGS